MEQAGWRAGTVGGGRQNDGGLGVPDGGSHKRGHASWSGKWFVELALANRSVMVGRFHFVRVGLQGRVGRFTSPDATRFPRGAQVIVRTDRGLETGQVLAPPSEQPDWGASDGTLVRGMTVEDQLLEARLDKHRDSAFRACAERLRKMQLPVALMDVEHLFDGQTLYFYFLGPMLPELEALTAELAEAYESQVQFRKFTETLTAGCGPACGTAEAEGCGISCGSGCAVAGVCGTRKAAH